MDAENLRRQGDDVEFTGQGLALGIGVRMAIGNQRRRRDGQHRAVLPSG